MVKYAKPRKRTEKKYLRPLSPRTVDIFLQRKMESVEKRLERIISGNSLTPAEEFLRRYNSTVCRFRLAQENKQDTNSIYREICQLENEAYDFELGREDLISLNRLFRDKKTTELEGLLKKLETKTHH